VRGLVASVWVSQTGTAMSAVAIPWLVLVLTGSAGRTGLTGFTDLLPYVVAQATCGPIADRLGWRRTCVVGNLAAAVAVCAVPLLSAADALSFGALPVESRTPRLRRSSRPPRCLPG
jgi:MFS family permease